MGWGAWKARRTPIRPYAADSPRTDKGPTHSHAQPPLPLPLSTYQNTQCRKCTPSYRALPKDYPKPPCSERSPEEEAVLNDTCAWRLP